MIVIASRSLVQPCQRHHWLSVVGIVVVPCSPVGLLVFACRAQRRGMKSEDAVGLMVNNRSYVGSCRTRLTSLSAGGGACAASSIGPYLGMRQ